MSENRVMYVNENGDALATWYMDGRPMVGDQVHKSYLPDGTWEVVDVQHCGNMQFRCVCKPTPQSTAG